MSRNNSYPRSKKSLSSKPYNASNASFVRRLTSRVSGYIPQSLRIGSWFGHPEAAPSAEEDCHSDEAAEEEEEFVDRGDVTREAQHERRHQRPQLGSIEQSVPPQKRARTDFLSQDEPHFSDSNNLSLSAIQTDIAGPSGAGRMELRRVAMVTSTMMSRGLPVPGPSGLHGHAVAGPSGMQLRPPAASSTPAVTRNPPPSALGKQQVNSQVNGDELSDSSESTSGCSSLVPQGGRHDSEQLRSNPLKRPANCPSRASSSMFEQRSLFSQSGGEVAVPQPAAASKRPAFDVSILSPQSRPVSSGDKPDVTNSPFYAGKTCYGGASAYRRSSPPSNMTGISYDSIVNTSLLRSPARNRGLNLSMSDVTSPRRIQISPVSVIGGSPALNTSQSEPSVSSVARRILDTMETLSSPVSDCSQIPLDESGWGSPSKRKRLPDSLYEYKSPRATRPGGPPAVPLPVPTVHELLKMKKMQAKLQDSTEAARKQALKGSKPVWQDTRPAYSLRQDEADGSRHTNKMKRKQKDKDDEEEYELPEQVNLPNISLTMTGLPTFDLGLSPARSSPAPNPPLEDNPIFTFASPIVVKNISKTPSKNNFKLVSPAPSIAKPLHSISEPLKFNWQNNKSPNFSNIPKGINCISSSGTSESKKHNKQVNDSTPKLSSQEPKVTTNSLGNMFKPAPGSWECGTCAIRNKSDAKVCIACTAERPNAAKSITASSLATVSSTPQLSSGFGTQFSRAGKWECDGCFNQNDNAMLKCPSCSTPNPKASNSQAASSAPAAASTITPSFGFGAQFKKPENSWECSVCLVVNKDAAAMQCISCQSHKLGEEANETSQTSKPLFSFGVVAKDSKTETSSPSNNFKFGIEPDVNAKQPVSSSSFGPAKPFSFGIPATAASTTTPTLATAGDSSAVNTPLFSFGIPQTKPEENTPKLPEKKITFPTENVSFPSPKSTISPSLKRSADSEQKSFQFAASTSESTKLMFPVVNDNKQKESSLPISGFATKNDSKNEEPSAKKSFSFTAATPKSNEGTTTSAPNFMVGSGAGSPASSVFPASNSGSANFVFKPASATVSAAPTPSSQTPLFSFGATSGSKNAAGPGFSSPSFGAKPAETKPNLNFGAAPKTTETSEPAKFAFGSSTVGPNFGASTNSSTTPSFGSPAPTTTNSPAFGANPVTASSGMPLFGAGSTNSTAPLFGAPSTTIASSIPSFGSNTASPSVPAFGAASVTSSTPTVPQFGAPATGNTTMFGSTSGTAISMFGTPNTTAPPAFGAPATSVTSTPVFGAPVKSVSFGDSTKSPNLGASSNTTAQFSFGSKPQAATTNNAPPAYPFSSTQAVGGFSFGSNAGAPVNSASTFGFGTANNATDNKSPFGGFGSSSSGFPAVKPAETTSMFGSTASPGFGGAAAPTPAPAFGAAPQQFGETNNSFQTPNFGFGNTQATPTQTPFGFPASHNSNAGQNAAAPSAFMFGQQQQQQQQPAATAAAPPQFNPNIRPTFNFTSGAAPAVFSATPSAQTSSVGPQRRYKKAMRRIPQAPPR